MKQLESVHRKRLGNNEGQTDRTVGRLNHFAVKRSGNIKYDHIRSGSICESLLCCRNNLIGGVLGRNVRTVRERKRHVCIEYDIIFTVICILGLCHKVLARQLLEHHTAVNSRQNIVKRNI